GALMSVMLEDALKIGEARAETDGDLPAYGRPQVEALLARLRPLPFGHPLPLLIAVGETRWHLTFFPAGHVLGAAMALLETPEGTVLVSGDVSITPQRTVGPAVLPRAKVDALVLESTYGNRLHSQRAAEEARLVAQVREVLARGGHCLIPAFALGRAQEVLLILAEARRRGELAGPVWVDGLVRAVCGVYQSYGESGHPHLRRLIARQGNPFFTGDGPVRAIQRPEERAKILQGEPAVIVSSSGMLQGGPSAFYATKLAGDERHAILITGYQDEEAPGRRLLDLSQPGAERDRKLTLGGVEVAVRCAISRYHLSAHADGDELAALAERLRPGLSLLVHGDGEAREGLAGRLTQRDLACRLPENGETVEISSGSGRQATPAVTRPDPTESDLVTIAERRGPGRSWTARELAERHYGQATATGVLAVEAVLREGGAFVPDPLRPTVYRLARARGWVESPGPASQEWVRQRLDEAFRAEPTLVKASLYPAERRVALRFSFPDLASVQHASTLARLEAETGWQVEIRPTPEQGALQAAVERQLPPGLRVLAPPSVRLDTRTVTVRVEGTATPDDLVAARAAYRDTTGYELIVERAGVPAADSDVQVAGESGEDAVARPASGVAPLEINLALPTVRESLEADGATVYQVGKRGEAIAVTFLTPAVGRRWQLLLDQLAESLGWPIVVADQPRQDALIETVRQIIGRRIAKGPGIHAAEERIRVRLAADEHPDTDEVVAWRREVLAKSGYALEVEMAPRRE
ncbi:MAG TPA: MBL fold metallo-hydrolase, partial [Chloroflexota bacterium]|nr:MBL fold metallo-hydrolase [Chloroflexota bacterium]